GQAPKLDPEVAELLHVEATPDLDQAVPVEDPDAVVGEDAEGNPITAGYLALVDGMTHGQKIWALLIGIFNTVLSMDPTELGIKKAHGASAQLVIVQDIETAYRTSGHPDLPPEVQRPPVAEGILPPSFAGPTRTPIRQINPMGSTQAQPIGSHGRRINQRR